RLCQFLRGARRRGESENLVAFVLGSFADRSQGSSLAGTRHPLQTYDSVVAGRDLLNRCALAGAQVWMFLLDVTPCLGTHQRFIQILSSAHLGDCVALIANHLFRGERAGWRFALYFDQAT